MSQKPSRFGLLFSTAAEPAQETPWRPRADVYRTRDGWLLKFELAGVALDDVAVSAQGSAITVSGVRRDRIVEESCWHYSMEISYSRFERTVHLPCTLDSARLSVDYENGILWVRVHL